MIGSPDLLRSRVVLRSRSVSEVLDLALRFVVVHARAYALVALGSLLPALLLALLAGSVLGWPLAWLVSLPLAVAAQAPFTVLASRLVFESHVGTGEVLRTAAAGTPRFLLGRAFATMFIVIGTTLFIVPGLYIAPIFRFTGESALLEQKGVFESFVRAQRLAADGIGDLATGTAALALIFVASIILGDVAGRALIGEVLQIKPPRSLFTEFGSALATLGMFAVIPYITTARFLLYLNVRTRTEGWDIYTLLSGIAARIKATNETRAA